MGYGLWVVSEERLLNETSLLTTDDRKDFRRKSELTTVKNGTAN